MVRAISHEQRRNRGETAEGEPIYWQDIPPHIRLTTSQQYTNFFAINFGKTNVFYVWAFKLHNLYKLIDTKILPHIGTI